MSNRPTIKTAKWAAACVLAVITFMALLAFPRPETLHQEAANICGQTILKPGIYTLQADCTATKERALITVSSSNVTIDLNGHTLRCPPTTADGMQHIGILGQEIDTPGEIIIHNGRITNCVMGINIPQAEGPTTVTNIDFTGTLSIGVSLNENRNILRSNIFSDIGGEGTEKEAYSVGINRPGNNCLIENNVFKNIYKQDHSKNPAHGEGVAILIAAKQRGCVIRDNMLENENSDNQAIGIWGASESSARIENNRIKNFHRAIIGIDDATLTVTGNTVTLAKPLDDSYGIEAVGGTVSQNTIQGPFEVPLLAGEGAAETNTILP